MPVLVLSIRAIKADQLQDGGKVVRVSLKAPLENIQCREIRTFLRLRSPDGPVPDARGDDRSRLPRVSLPCPLRVRCSARRARQRCSALSQSFPASAASARTRFLSNSDKGPKVLSNCRRRSGRLRQQIEARAFDFVRGEGPGLTCKKGQQGAWTVPLSLDQLGQRLGRGTRQALDFHREDLLRPARWARSRHGFSRLSRQRRLNGEA